MSHGLADQQAETKQRRKWRRHYTHIMEQGTFKMKNEVAA
jgi:hypothetical protein